MHLGHSKVIGKEKIARDFGSEGCGLDSAQVHCFKNHKR